MSEAIIEQKKTLPDEHGYYGEFGGRYVPPVLVPALDELEAAYRDAQAVTSGEETRG